MTVGEGRRLVAIACLYASYGIDLGLLGSGAPLMLRAHGMPLAAVGLVQLIYLPIGLGFLWAPLLDRWHGPFLPHRTGWIVGAQGAAAVLLAGLAAASGAPIVILIALAVAVSIAMATTDLSSDALVARTSDAGGRASAATAKLVGSSLGTAVGIALATLFADRLRLPGALLAAAGATLLLTVPMLFFGERRAVERPGATRAAAALSALPASSKLAASDRRLLAGRAARLGAFFATSLALGTAPGLLLIDLHVPLATTGLITGPLGTGLGTAMTLLSGFVLARTAVGAARLLVVFAIGTIGAGVLLLIAAINDWGSLAAAATLIGAVSSSGLGVPIFATLYRWADGPRAATDYAVLFGAAFLLSFPARLATPAMAALLGWPGFFALAIPLFAASVAVLAAGMVAPIEAARRNMRPARAAHVTAGDATSGASPIA